MLTEASKFLKTRMSLWFPALLVTLATVPSAVAGAANIHVAKETLVATDSAVAAAVAAMDAINLDELNVRYQEGKSIQSYRDLLRRQAHLITETTKRLRSRDSLSLAVIVAQSLAGMQLNIRDLSAALETAGQLGNSAGAVRAALSLLKAQEGLAEPSAALDERVQEVAIAAEDALARCR